jgi:hypothetical protein
MKEANISRFTGYARRDSGRHGISELSLLPRIAGANGSKGRVAVTIKWGFYVFGLYNCRGKKMHYEGIRMTGRHGLLLAILLVIANPGGGDELLMKNGSRLVGTLVSASDGSVIFDTPYAGELTITSDNIETIITEEKVTLLMQDGSIFRDKLIVAKDDTLTVLGDDQMPIQFAATDINQLNPEPWRLGDGYKWYGQANTALESERGNTDTDELDIDFESIWRSLEDRFTMRGSWEIDETDGSKKKNNWKSRNKYDRFRVDNPDHYYGIQAAFEHDEFADLDLRTIVGPYIGRQFFETKLLTMHGEVGVVYVDEQFDLAEDHDYWGSSWELRLSSGIIPKTELYLHSDGLVDYGDVESVVVNTTFGIGFPLLWGFKAAAEAKYEYDGGAVEGVDDMDQTYNFKLGYAW